jgi:hypothetical protein
MSWIRNTGIRYIAAAQINAPILANQRTWPIKISVPLSLSRNPFRPNRAFFKEGKAFFHTIYTFFQFNQEILSGNFSPYFGPIRHFAWQISISF